MASLPTRRPTIRDVAALAGVSHQTVSRYFRDSGEGLKPATLASVRSAIEALDYRPNLIARALNTRRTGRLAVLLPAMTFNPARMLAGASAAAHAAGYSVDVMSPEGGAQGRSGRALELSDSGQVEGIVSFAPLGADRDVRDHVSVPLVVASQFDDQMRGTGELADASPVGDLVERLVELGHRRFYHVAGPADFPSAQARRRAYLDAVDLFGVDSIGIHDGDWSGQSGIDAVHALAADRRPTAIVAANDLMAAGVMHAAAARGWAVPGQVSVTGWDNDAMAQYLTPALTSVDINLELVGHNAMRRLIAAVRHEDADLPTTTLQRIIWRDSTAPAPSD